MNLQDDTVQFYIPLFEASVNLKSLIAGDELIVNQLLLKNCRIAPTVNSEGKANWDILLSSGSPNFRHYGNSAR